MDSLPPQQMIIPLKAAVLTIIFMLILCIVNTMARTAGSAVSDAKLKQMSEDGNKRAKRLRRLLENRASDIRSSFEFCSFLFIMVLIAVSEYAAYIYFRNIVLPPEFSVRGIHIASAVIGAVLICIIYTALAEAAPKRIAAKHAERIAVTLSGYMRAVVCCARPFLWFISLIARFVSAVFGVKDGDISGEVTEEEIRMMVDIGSESGAIDDDEKQMIHNIFEMDDKPVEDIMTHRTEACVLWEEDGIDEWKTFIDETNHTRYPVCGESIDDVIGIVTSREFYRLLLSGGKDVSTIMREVFFIPDTIKADELLSKMQRENEHMGIVMDEYGGFQGIVTQEDLIEEIVGELYSEYDEPETEDDEIVRIDDNTWSIFGSTEIEAVEEALGISIEDGDFNTFAGLILSELQTIPADGEKVELETNHMRIKVISVADHRIEQAVVSVITDDENVSRGESMEENEE